MPSGDYSLLILFALLGVMMWFMSRRTRKQQREAAQFRDNLAPGQEVMTGSGFFGVVTAVDGDRITLTSDGSRSVWLRQAIAKVVEPPVAEDSLVEESEGSNVASDESDNPTS